MSEESDIKAANRWIKHFSDIPSHWYDELRKCYLVALAHCRDTEIKPLEDIAKRRLTEIICSREEVLQLEEQLRVAVETIRMLLKCHGCGCESASDGSWTCPAHEALQKIEAMKCGGDDKTQL